MKTTIICREGTRISWGDPPMHRGRPRLDIEFRKPWPGRLFISPPPIALPERLGEPVYRARLREVTGDIAIYEEM